MMIGQDILLFDINNAIRENRFPRFSILVGDGKSCKIDIAHYISAAMKADYIKLPDVKVDTVREMIKQAYKLHNTTVYCIPDADDMSVNAKNAMLKVVEDTPNRAYFVMCLDDENNTLATIRSRGIIYRTIRPMPCEIKDFARELYVNKEDIDETDINIIGEICHSEEDVDLAIHTGVKRLYDYARYVADNVSNVDGAEVFKFSDALAIKDEEDKIDVEMFLRILQRLFMKDAVRYEHENVRAKCLTASCIGRYLSDLRIKGINKTMLINNMWLEVRKIWKSQT